MELDLLPLALQDPFIRRYATSRSWYSFRDGILHIAGDGDENRILAHELAHFFEHVSTPMGLFRTELHLRQTECTIGFLSNYRGVVHTPVHKWVTRFRNKTFTRHAISDPELFKQLIDEHVKHWVACAWIGEALDGVTATEAKCGTISKASAILQEVEQGIVKAFKAFSSSHERMFYPLNLPTDCDRLSLSPTENIPVDDGQLSVPINGLHVSETMAQLQEGIIPGEFDKLGVEYTTLPLLTAIRWKEQHRSAQALNVPQIANTCLAIADLSLFSPLGAVYGILRTPDLSWFDLHPGYRFMRALDAVAKLNIWLKNLDEAEVLANQTCDYLGWVRPECFIKIGAQLQIDQFKAHRDACRIRSNNYSAFMTMRRDGGGEWIPDFLDNHMPITAHPKHGVVCPIPNDETHAPVARLRDCCLARLCWKVMGSPNPISILELFPDGFPYNRHFEDQYTSPMAIYELFVQKRPWAAIERYQLLDE